MDEGNLMESDLLTLLGKIESASRIFERSPSTERKYEDSTYFYFNEFNVEAYIFHSYRTTTRGENRIDFACVFQTSRCDFPNVEDHAH